MNVHHVSCQVAQRGFSTINRRGKARARKQRMTQPRNETGTAEARRNHDVTQIVAQDTAKIEEFIRALEGESGTPSGLMREHLEAARFYLLGVMPSEYEFNLQLAHAMLTDIEDKELQSRLAAFLHRHKI